METGRTGPSEWILRGQTEGKENALFIWRIHSIRAAQQS